jgi:hypothetical protein
MSNRLRMLAPATLLLGVLGAIGPAHAATVTVGNPGFEDPAVPSAPYWLPGATDWTVASAGVYNPVSGTLTPQSQVAWANGSASAPGTLTQTLPVPVTVNTRYTLMVDVGWRSDVATAYPTFPGFTVELLAGSSVLASETSTQAPPAGQLMPFTLVYDVLPGNPLVGEALGIRLGTSGIQVNFDNVALDASPVPLPAPLVLLGSAIGLATSLFGRRRQKAA